MQKSFSATWVPTLYFTEGLPYIVITVLSVVIYKQLGLDNAHVAAYTSLLYLPWVIKPFWSPIVDLMLTKRVWVIAMQLAMAIGFGGIAFTLKADLPVLISLSVFFILAFLSATHDIAADGFYMIALTAHEQSLWVGLRTVCYRVGMIAGQGGLVWLGGYLERSTGSIPMAWAWVMAILSVTLLLLALWHTIMLPQKEIKRDKVTRINANGSVTGRNTTETEGLSADSFISVFSAFFRKPGVGMALIFIFLFRFPEAQVQKLFQPFLLDPNSVGGMGLTAEAVGFIYGTLGTLALIAGGILGGIAGATFGLKRCIKPMAWIMSSSCVVFLVLSYFTTASWWIVCIAVSVEQLCYGFGMTAFTLYLLFFSQGPLRTSFYAICTGFMALGMMLPGMAAGWIQQQLGYQGFFWWTTICCSATIVIAMLVKVPADFGLKSGGKNN